MRPDPDILLPTLEAVLFAADQPVTPKTLAELFAPMKEDEVVEGLARLKESYDTDGRGVTLMEIAGGYQILTREPFAPWVDMFLRGRRKVRLSRSALEALGIIAYKQPVTKVEIDEIRGVDSSGVVATLMERGLVSIAGRAEGVGRPLLYATTQEFLSYFGLSSVDELPRLSELTQLMETGVAQPEAMEEAASELEAAEDRAQLEEEALDAEAAERAEEDASAEGDDGADDAMADADALDAADAEPDAADANDAHADEPVLTATVAETSDDDAE